MGAVIHKAGHALALTLYCTLGNQAAHESRCQVQGKVVQVTGKFQLGPEDGGRRLHRGNRWRRHWRAELQLRAVRAPGRSRGGRRQGPA